MERLHCSVVGITSNEQKTQLKNALEKLDGIQLIAINIDKATVEIGWTENTVSPQEIKTCIQNTGFTITQINS